MPIRKGSDRVLGVLFLTVIFVFCALNAGTIADWLGQVMATPSTATQSTLETAYTEDFNQHDAFVDLNGLVSRWMGKRVLNERVLLYNGTLASVYQTAKESAVDYTVSALTQTWQYLQARKIPFLYVHAPVKFNDDPSVTPMSMESNLQSLAEETFARLKTEGVEFLSLKQEMEADGLDFYASFFRTDHHWKPETALWACDQTLEKLSQRFGIAVDVQACSPSRWQTETYPNSFLGSDGKRVGIYFAGVDDFSVLTPAQPTSLTFYCPDRRFYREGDFTAALLEKSHIGEYHTTNAYDTYLDGGGGMQRIVNHNNPSGPRILVLGDSYSQPYVAFLAMACSECIRLDMRYFTDCTLYDYLEQNDFDCVVSLFNGVYVNHGTLPIVPEQTQTEILLSDGASVLSDAAAVTVFDRFSVNTEYRVIVRGTTTQASGAPYFTATLLNAANGKALASKAFMADCNSAQVWTFQTPKSFKTSPVLVLTGVDNAEITLNALEIAQYIK